MNMVGIRLREPKDLNEIHSIARKFYAINFQDDAVTRRREVLRLFEVLMKDVPQMKARKETP
mgnify:FL=1